MKRASPSSGIGESEDFFLDLIRALAREAAKRDHDSSESSKLES
jgi:hypothetical protein